MRTVRGYILTETKIPALIRGVYARSEPVGMGYMHVVEGPISEPDVVLLQALGGWNDLDPDKKPTTVAPRTRLYMDYVRGRCCKMRVLRLDDGRLFAFEEWPDHSLNQMRELMTEIGAGDVEEIEVSF